jgi:glycerol-3-phosphate dehydrogenase
MALFDIGSRARNLAALRSGEFDVLIIGGGINGAGIARDLALRTRDLRIALVEKNHFGWGTSGRNSHLIHGGLRYLKYFDFGLVRQALRERAVLLDIAPHLVSPLAFLMPFESRAKAVFYRAGLTLYDVLAGGYGIGRHRSVRLPEHVAPGFVTAARFYDCRVESARLVLDNVLEAAGNGVCAANYVEAIGRRPPEVRLRDRMNGDEFTIRARTVFDATGAWTDATADVRLVRGSHIVVPRSGSGEEAIAWFDSAGRIVFFIPWGEDRDLLLIGTTDIDHAGTPDDVRISRAEVEYLMAAAKRVLRGGTYEDPITAFSSLRPLIRTRAGSATSATREHRIWRDEHKVVRITGGKYTTYRAMAEEAVDLAFPELKGRCRTATTPVNGNSRSAVEILSRHVRAAVVNRYGVHTPDFLRYEVKEAEAAPIAFAAHHEMAQCLADVMFVSTTWGYERAWTEEELRPYAYALGAHLGWTNSRTAAEAEAVYRMTVIGDC